MKTIEIDTKCGRIKGIEKENTTEWLGIKSVSYTHLRAHETKICYCEKMGISPNRKKVGRCF